MDRQANAHTRFCLILFTSVSLMLLQHGGTRACALRSGAGNPRERHHCETNHITPSPPFYSLAKERQRQAQIFSLFPLDLDTALANHHSSKQTTTCDLPPPRRRTSWWDPHSPREGRGCTELLGVGSSAGCAWADVVVRGGGSTNPR